MQDLEYILEVVFGPGTWGYRSTITEIGKTRKRRDWEWGGGGGEGDGVMRVGVMRHGIENFDSAKLHLGCLLRHSSGCQKGNSEPKQSSLGCFLYPPMETNQAVSVGKVLLRTQEGC